jgi:hypothetical protein
MRSNAGMANRQGDVDLREAQVSAPQLTLWLGLAPSYHSHLPTYEDGTDRVFRNFGLIKFRRLGTTQKTIYYIHNTAKVRKLQ